MKRIWIFCPRKSGIESASALAEKLSSMGVKGEVWGKVSRPPKNQGALMLGWGREFPPEWQRQPGTLFLNDCPKRNKFQELARLKEMGVKVPPFSAILPPGGGEWIPRRMNHQKGGDFLNPPTAPDYFTLRVPLAQEFRVHVFQGKSIRLGKQFKRDDFPNPHPWVRNYHTGWVYLWGGSWRNAIPSGVREVATKAVKALGRDTGAVDLGVTQGGEVFVLEVNTTPALEPNTITLYSERLLALAGGVEG